MPKKNENKQKEDVEVLDSRTGRGKDNFAYRERMMSIMEEYVNGKLGHCEEKSLQQIQEEHNLSESYAKSHRITHTKTWQELLDRFDDHSLLKVLNDIGLDDSNKPNERINAIKEIMKLKKRYPEQQRDRGKLGLKKEISQFLIE